MTTLLSLLSFSLFTILCSSQVNEFAFTGFNHPETNLTFNGAARYQNGVLQLTDQTSNINGHAFYPSPIQFKSSSTANVSSFSTCFVFSIHPEYPDLGFGGGHGFAFAIATNKQLIYSSLPSRSQYLGLLNDNDVGNQIFAVEFDTVKDSELDDINDNHVGININSLVSNAAAAAAYYTNDSVKHDLDLRSGNRVVAWIDYDSIKNLVNVTLSSTSAKPITPLLSLAVDLTPILRQKMYVGFSASTGWLTSSSHYISGWSFKMMGESKPLDLGSLPSAPAAGNEIKYNMKLYNRLTHRYSLLENRQFPTAKTPMGIPSWNYWQISIALAVSLLLSVCFVYSKTREKRRRSLRATTVAMGEFSFLAMGEFSSSTVESLQYDIAQIRAATADFSDANKLGRGGFGFVYKGIFENGQEIAVKRLSGDSNQGNAEFRNEVLLVAELQHRNLVKLLGFALEGSEKLLVYEYVENASLDRFIFDPIKRSTLDWDTRTKIIKGVVRGLVYLHVDSRLRIIHRDLKPSNILLDGDMNPKIADFGIAKLSKHDEVQGHTHRIVGTFGYMAPEYAMHGEFSIKSDVYSFGVLILEIISGRKNIESVHQEYLVTDIWKNWQKGTPAHMVDPDLLQQNSTSSLSEMVKYIQIGLLCIQENADDRPTMTEVLRMLDAPNSTLPQPSNPAFYSSSGVDTMADQGQVATLPITPVVKGPDPNPKRSFSL